MITATGISKTYGDLKVLKNVNITINQSEVISIVGASGAGKSTLLHILGTLDKPDSGKLSINDTEITSLNDKKLASFRNKNIGFVFQFHHLLPEFTALENVCIPAFISGKSVKETEQRAKELLHVLNIDARSQHKPNQLSGGEQQRVAVARALINNPSVVFADEPSGNLDSLHASELHELFFKLRNQFKQTFVIVTHNDEFANMADRKLVMKDGVILD